LTIKTPSDKVAPSNTKDYVVRLWPG